MKGLYICRPLGFYWECPSGRGRYRNMKEPEVVVGANQPISPERMERMAHY